MLSLDQHIKTIQEAINAWLQPDNEILMGAIQKTVDENLFDGSDIRHRIRHLKNSVTENNLSAWCSRAGLESPSLIDREICCLHAGNIPLVGFHNLLAVLLTGANYYGKLSRKDPYLMSSFLKVLENFELVKPECWATQLDHFQGINADAVLFSGSEASVTPVRKSLAELKIANDKTPELIRTAHFSIAWITDNKKETMENLTEAVFRYGGNGCRSVAYVVAPFSLKNEKCTFTDYVESFWLNNPQHQKPSPSLYHRYAYNRAVGIEQAWLEDFLIEETMVSPDEKFVLHWIEGGLNEVEDIIRMNTHVQSVYSNSEIGEKIVNKVVEPLSQAQTPPVWWKADGIDTIKWMLDRL